MKQSEPQTWLKRLGSKTDLNWDKNLIAKIILLGMLKGINAVLAEGSGKGEEEAINAQDDDFVSRRVAVEYLEGKPFRFRRGGVLLTDEMKRKHRLDIFYNFAGLIKFQLARVRSGQLALE